MNQLEITVADAVAEADLRVLLMCLVHLTGDTSWLEPPYRPRRDVRIIAAEDAGLPDDIADRIRAAAVRHAHDTPLIGTPDDELMVRMMSVCLGHPVPPEYAPMMLEEMGLASRDVPWPQGVAKPPDLDVLVVGAGPSGIAMGVRLARLGIAYTIVEAGSAVGGVWRDNRYPGCAVDTPNHAYSFSFAPPNRWSRYFAPQPELDEYMQRISREFMVSEHVLFDTAVTSAAWSADAGRWIVQLDGPGGREQRSVAVLVSAIGQLNDPRLPDIDGLDSFDGASFHSARWPDDLQLAGAHVAVLGTGASAMQIVPTIADQVASLTIYQRSPQWARPVERYHDPIPAGTQWLLEQLPFYAQWYRFTMLWRFGDGLHPYLQKDPAWPHPERSLNRRNDEHRAEMTQHLVSELAGRADLIDQCLPDYPPYGKRILLDNGWFRSLLNPKVTLVTDPVARVEHDAVVTTDGTRRPADVIVLATGFQVTEMAARLDITGRDGHNLREVWADDNPSAYLGISVPGFPNLFCMQGPNTGLGHGGSAIFQSECQARHITGCLVAMAERGAGVIEVTQQAHDADVAAVDAAHERMIWTHPGMSTYYRNPRGRVVTVMPWTLVDYWSLTHDVDVAAYTFR